MEIAWISKWDKVTWKNPINAILMTILSTLIAIHCLKAPEPKLCIQLKLIATKCVTMDNHQLTICGEIIMAVDTGTIGGTRGCDYYSSG